jgi:signal transduction histidine kinase
MSPAAAARSCKLWPRSMFGRIALVLFSGLAAAHVLTLSLLMYERGQSVGAMMLSYLAKDVASSIAILERLPANERQEWLPRLARRNYSYVLGDRPSEPASGPTAQGIASAVSRELADPHDISVTAPPASSDPLRLDIHLRLRDQTPLTIEITPPSLMVSGWVVAALTLQLALLGLFTWLAVRIATKPLARLAQAAEALGPDLRGPELPENGPTEVLRAAIAFNAMQRRIVDHLAERSQILASISHDLQSPITRMRLRADLIDDADLKQRLQSDLEAMQTLVTEGIDFARSSHAHTEPPVATDLQALLESIVFDYVDSGHQVRLTGQVDTPPLWTQPQALRRVITNIIDNALKFAGEAEISVSCSDADHLAVIVRDHGPGIPESELAAVLRPFYRTETSRNRETGGTGLGLAIANQLAAVLKGRLVLANNESGGLKVSLLVPTSPS